MTALNTPSDQPGIADRWRDVLATIAPVPDDVTIAVSLRHLGSGAQHHHLGDRPFVAASTIKLLILIAVSRALDAGTLDLSSRIVPNSLTRVGGSGVLNWLSHDLAPTIADHAWLMIAVSDNTASNVLIDAVGLPAIQDVQHDLGLTGTALHRHFMSQKRRPEDPSNSVSASDLATTLVAIATDRAASPSDAPGCDRCSAISNTGTGSPGTCLRESTTREKPAGRAGSSMTAVC